MLKGQRFVLHIHIAYVSMYSCYVRLKLKNAHINILFNCELIMIFCVITNTKCNSKLESVESPPFSYFKI